ncbi:MAG TPA: matrixin family metalloprotease [Actinophytocola sp.]|jgi:hypothetical protein|nr:matrixin family metalloprotease [Actinophytocola sp.]
MSRNALLSLVGSVAFAAVAVAPLATSAPASQPSDGVTVVGEAIIAGATLPVTTTATKVATPSPACVNTAYAMAPWKLTSTFKWYYNPAKAPASVSATALDTLKTGTRNVMTGQNRCGATPALKTTDAYQGTSTKVAQVSATGACTGNDNVSVTSWGDLPPTTLAYTCTYYRTGTGAVLGSDMLIDNKVHQWFTTMPASCANKFDLLSVVVHERGHTVGLAHVDQLTHAIETMSPKTRPCDTSKRLLAGGDVAGLNSLYAR